jgi:hypothetical protein
MCSTMESLPIVYRPENSGLVSTFMLLASEQYLCVCVVIGHFVGYGYGQASYVLNTQLFIVLQGCRFKSNVLVLRDNFIFTSLVLAS